MQLMVMTKRLGTCTVSVWCMVRTYVCDTCMHMWVGEFVHVYMCTCVIV